MFRLLDLDTLPIQKVGSPAYKDLIRQSRGQLADEDMFNLSPLLRAETIKSALAEIEPHVPTALPIRREQSIYGTAPPDGLPPEHPAAQRLISMHRVVPASRLPKDSILGQIYTYDPLQRFIAETLGLRRIYPLQDAMMQFHVMILQPGDSLNWRFDTAPFAVTLVLQASKAGGIFEYCRRLRTDKDPNIDNVGNLLSGVEMETQATVLSAGTLNVFRGHYTAHRTTPVQGKAPCIAAVFNYGS